MGFAADLLNVLAVEPFFGGSHRRFLESVRQQSRHRWQLVTGKPVHWKWRMRSASLSLATATAELLATGFEPDVVFCSDMLDLPQWRGVLRNPRLLTTPTVLYFHENQWTYPVAPQARVDHHFGYTNLLSALSADAAFFNSRFHLEAFLSASQQFLRRMPDSYETHDLDRLGQRSEVVPPGFSPPTRLPERNSEGPMTIGWVARWEHDKRPDQFAQLLDRLRGGGSDFRLHLLGPRPRKPADSLASIRRAHADRIRSDGFAQSSDEYWQRLSEMDVVVSTADHEFFGIAVCEAIWAGAIPVLPNRLSYPELAPPECLYTDMDDAVRLLESMQRPEDRSRLRVECQRKVDRFRSEQTVARLDDALERVSQCRDL